MPPAAGITFADHASRLYARRYGWAPREGLALLADAPPERRAVVLEWAAFADFLVARLPDMEKEWKAHREALRAAGELPEDSDR